MKTWTSDNPKARLLTRKREAILGAARRQFLENGYGGTSMEAVASDAGVSIMTLYRHAESKDDLFAAVVGIACHNSDEPEPDLSGLALSEILMATGIAFQQKLTSPETTALLRAVIAEHDRFPELATVAYEAVVGHLASFVGKALSAASEAASIGTARRNAIGKAFVDDLFGADTIRVLLGLSRSTDREIRRRAEEATEKLIASLAS